MKVAEWIAALRSGKYEQGQNALCADGRFCCLGVLAEEAGVRRLDGDERSKEGYNDEVNPVYKFGVGGSDYAYSTTSIPSFLWPTFLEDLDLGMIVPETDLHMQDTLHSRLMSMNDEGSTFSDIADYIEDVTNGQR